MADSILADQTVARAVSNIKPRSERQPDVDALERTYVETGVLPQLNNSNNQILYGRRGTGKSHVLRVMGVEVEEDAARRVLYVDIRLLGSAQLMSDPTKPLTVRCVSVFKDLLSIMQSQLLDIATDPARDGGGIEEVSAFADLIVAKSIEVSSRLVATKYATKDSDGAKLGATVSANPNVTAEVSASSEQSAEEALSYTEAYRDTVVFAEVAHALNTALTALEIENLYVLIDEWTAIPVEVQPYIAEFIKRVFFPSNRITVKIASLEYRSRFTLDQEGSPNKIGFELGGDISANLDLDDYYVYDRNPAHVAEIFLELLYKHVEAELPVGYLASLSVNSPEAFRSRFFNQQATFVELVRAGEGVVRDFLGVFTSAFFKASRSGRQRIDLLSVEEAARDWYETDKSTVLSDGQRNALDKIMRDVIATRQAKMFMLARVHADHPMIQSLFDARLIHLISRGYSDRDNPSLRYNIYSLDYGTYVDLKRTHSAPDQFEMLPDGIEVPDRIVPFADKRSIRRIILDPAIFEVEG